MVNLPQVDVEKSVSQGAQSRVSGGEVESAFNTLAAGLDRVGDTFRAAETENAQLEGQNAVYRDETGALRYTTRSNLSQSGRAFNRAARTAALAGYSDDAKSRLQQFVNEANGDVEKYDALASEYLNQTIANQDDKLMSGPVKLALEGEIALTRRGMVETQTRNDLAANESAIKEHIANTEAELMSLARDGGTASPEYLKKMEDLQSLYGEMVGNPAFSTNQREIDARIKRVTSQATGEWVVGRVKDAYVEGGIPAAEKFLNEELANPALTLSPSERKKYQREGNTILNGFKAEHRANMTQLRKDASPLLAGFKNGEAQDDLAVDDMIVQLEAGGDAVTASKLRVARSVYEQHKWFAAASDKEQLAATEALQDKIAAGGGSIGLIKKFEGFSNGAYWDVNAYRAGYGSDTITKADGSVVRIKKGDWVSREDAERDLARRSAEFANTAASQVGRDVWQGLPRHVQAALTSLAYNYGSLPDRVVPAVKSGDTAAIAAAVRGLGGDNNGINRNRRNTEASVIEGSGAGGFDAGDTAAYKDARKEVFSDAKANWANIRQGLLKGDSMSQESLEMLYRQSLAAGDQDFANEIDDFFKTRIADFPGMTPLQMQSTIDDVMAGGVDPGEEDALQSMRTQYQATVDALQKDPLGLIAKAGNYSGGVRTIDFSNEQTMAQSLMERQGAVNFIKEFYGKDAGALRPAEVDALASRLENAPAQNRAAFLFSMSKSLAPETYMETMGQLYPKMGPVFGIAGDLMRHDPRAAEAVLRGQEAIKINPKYAPSTEKQDDVTAMMAAFPRDSMAPDLAQAYEDHTQAARAIYADLSNQVGDMSGTFNPDRWQRAVNSATGGLVEFRGKKVVAPEYGMDQSGFEKLLNRLTDDDVNAFVEGPGGKRYPVSLATIMSQGVLTSYKDGQYLVQLTYGVPLVPGLSEALPYLAGNSAGNKFVLDISAETRAARDRNGGRRGMNLLTQASEEQTPPPGSIRNKPKGQYSRQQIDAAKRRWGATTDADAIIGLEMNGAVPEGKGSK